MTDPIRRTWVYCQPPGAYEVYCNLCGGEVEWSEYEHLVWCWRCLKDVPGSGGIFDGPIGVELCKILGISFDRIDLETGKRLRMQTEGDELVWR
jgi:hypothetical protein